MSTILVSGATGKQGGAVLAALANDQTRKQVRALSRNVTDPKRTEPLTSQGAQPVKGDLEDKASLVGALRGVDAAFLVTSPFNKSHIEGEIEQGKNFIDAAIEAGTVKHLVFTSVGSADTADVPHFQSKYKIEQYLHENWKHSWTIIRPVAFMDNIALTGVGRFFGLTFFSSLIGSNRKLQWIAVEDIGKVAAEALLHPEKHNKQIIELASDDLDIRGVQDAFGRATGSRPWRGWAPAFLLNLALPFDMVKMFRFFKDVGYRADVPALKKRYPGLMSFEDWVRKAHTDSTKSA